MKNLIISRNLWLVAGVCFLISFILGLASNKSTLLSVLNGITLVLMFVNAYMSHKKMISKTNSKNDQDSDNEQLRRY